MAKLKLNNTSKGKISDRFKARITHIGLSNSTVVAREVGDNLATTTDLFCGNKELYEVKYDATNNVDVVLSNSLTTAPFLLFTVFAEQYARKYHLLHKDTPNNLYYRDITLTKSLSMKLYDNAIFIRSLTIVFKGDGEAV